MSIKRRAKQKEDYGVRRLPCRALAPFFWTMEIASSCSRACFLPTSDRSLCFVVGRVDQKTQGRMRRQHIPEATAKSLGQRREPATVQYRDLWVAGSDPIPRIARNWRRKWPIGRRSLRSRRSMAVYAPLQHESRRMEWQPTVARFYFLVCTPSKLFRLLRHDLRHRWRLYRQRRL